MFVLFRVKQLRCVHVFLDILQSRHSAKCASIHLPQPFQHLLFLEVVQGGVVLAFSVDIGVGGAKAAVGSEVELTFTSE